MNDRERPIGVFDSGIGGLTVVNGLVKALPQEHLIYFGDTAHMPYGEKSAESVRAYALEIAEYLVERGSKMLVIACNTASSVAFEALQERWGHQLRIIDVIRPLTRQVAQMRLQKVGVIATKATISSNVYQQLLQAAQPDLQVAALATSLLAPMVEAGFFNDAISKEVIARYLAYPDFENMQGLLLACTHYPLIRPQIEAYFKGEVQVFDSVQAVVHEIQQSLAEEDLLRLDPKPGKRRFCLSDYTASFEATARIFYGKRIQLDCIPWRGTRLQRDSTLFYK